MKKPEPRKPANRQKESKHPPRQSVKTATIQSLHRDFIWGFILFAVTLIAYQPAWNGQPIWDDDGHITKPALRSKDGLARIWTQLGATQQYYPLVHSVFLLEYHLWGDSPLGYHLVNILLHFLSALLLVFILRRLMIPGAWFVAAIFALHPVQVESVAWITELKNTLSGVFFMSTALVYLKFDQERKTKFYAIAIGLFILGLMSKSVIAMLPVSLLIIFWWKRGKTSWTQDVVPLTPFFVVGIASGLFTAWVEHKFIIGGEVSTFALTFIERCLIAGRVVWFYLYKIFWPANLIFIYPRWNVNHAVWWQYLFPVVTLIFAGVLWVIRKRWRAPLAVFLYFTAMIFPVMGFFNVYPFRFSFVADHFQYLACIGPIAIVAGGMDRVFRSVNRFIKPIGSVILLLVLAVLTLKQSGIYADAETLYRTTIKKNQGCWMAHNNLGILLAEKGRMDEAKAHYQKAVELNPAYGDAHYNLGSLLAMNGQTNEAIVQYQKALVYNTNYVDAPYNLGLLLTMNGQTDEAIVQFRKALEINPKDGESHCKIGNLLVKSGRQDEAIVHYRKALEINPNFVEAQINLRVLLGKTGQ